jgi:hypothetical protein
MPIDRQLLEQILRTPESRDVSDSPIVTAIILHDASNAADLVPYLDQIDSDASINARRILCMFDAAAIPYLLVAMRNAGLEARKECIEILWSTLLGESAQTVREILIQVGPDKEMLLDDKRPLPDEFSEYVERDFRGRICDLAFIMLQSVVDSEYDQSLFRSLDDNERDTEIARLKRKGSEPGIV